MKLSVLLTTLLLSSTPALAEDFIYLKCKTTTNNIVFDWTETERLNHWVSNAEILYKINTKNEELFVSSNPEVVIQYELQHPGFNGWTEQVSDGRMSGESPWYLQYDPPGEIDGAMYHSDNERRLKYFGSIFGSCEASDSSAYEASK